MNNEQIQSLSRQIAQAMATSIIEQNTCDLLRELREIGHKPKYVHRELYAFLNRGLAHQTNEADHNFL